MISIIVPAYNAEAFLQRCVDSVLQQTYPAFELILVDDGSTDRTGALCDSYAQSDSRVTVKHQQNMGHTGARNTGLRCAKGSHVLFLDADDWLEERVLAVVEDQIASCQPDVVVYGLCRHEVSGQVKYLNGPLPDGCYAVPSDPAIVDGLLMDRLGGYLFPKSLSGKVFRKDIIEPIQESLPADILTGEDAAAFVLSVLDAQKLCIDTTVCYHFEVRSDSVSHRADPSSLRRAFLQLTYLQEMLEKRSLKLDDQLDRLAVQQIYSAVQRVRRAGLSHRDVRRMYASLQDSYPAEAAVSRASFRVKGYKLMIKKWILRHHLFFLVN